VRRSAGIALCLVALGACEQYKSTLAPTPALVLQVSPDKTSIPADGQSRVLITATIDPKSVDSVRTVIFTASKGTLFGQKAASGGGFEVQADGQGHAVIELQSSRDAGTSIVQAKAGTYAATTNVDFTTIDSNSIIQISASQGAIPADGLSTSTILATIKEGWLGADRKVTVTTTFGTLDGPTQTTVTPTADAQGRVSVLLRSPKETGFSQVTVTASGVSNFVTVTFAQALAESIHLQTNSAFLKASTAEKVHVTATLLRAFGTVSKNTAVVFRAVDSAGGTIGAFSAIELSDANGIAGADFSVGNHTYRGTVVITASIPSLGLSTSVQIVIIDP